ncbi:MAG: hypothetical protein WCI65_07740 [Synechococcaceae cyanobacterium ELA263]
MEPTALVNSYGVRIQPRMRNSNFGLNLLSLIKKSIKPSTTIYAPFTSDYSPSASIYELQGIKDNPYGCRGFQASYIITGTTNSAFAAGGVGAVYVGAIDGKSTSAGSGSGQWINFNVPFTGATGTSCYGADIISPGKGPGGIGKIDLVGTWTNNSSDSILGFFYEGSLNQLKDASAAPSQFKSFQAITSKDTPAKYTYLHSIDGGYAVGNFSTEAGYVGYFLNSGAESGSYVYNPKTNSQINTTYKDQYTFHTLFGIWLNKNNTYTVAGGGSTKELLLGFATASLNLPSPVAQGLPQDAAFGRGMLADIDPLTGIAKNEKYYNYQNDSSDQIFTHFQGIYYAGNGVYEVPFDALTSTGQFNVGIAYVKRQDNGTFSDNALWQTFQAPTTGLLASNDSVAGAGSVGAFFNGSLTTFASISETQAYLFAAQSLH